MKFKNYILFDDVFVKAVKEFIKLPIPLKSSYALNKCLLKLQEEEKIAKTARENLVKKYGEVELDENKEPKGWSVQSAPRASQEKFSKEVIELMEIEFELPIEEKIQVSISKCSDADISVESVNKISVLIDFVD